MNIYYHTLIVRINLKPSESVREENEEVSWRLRYVKSVYNFSLALTWRIISSSQSKPENQEPEKEKVPIPEPGARISKKFLDQDVWHLLSLFETTFQARGSWDWIEHIHDIPAPSGSHYSASVTPAWHSTFNIMSKHN